MSHPQNTPSTPSESSASDEMPCVAVLGTCDTKLDELLYVRTQLLEGHRVRVKLVDVGRNESTHPAVDINQSMILATASTTADPTSNKTTGDLPVPDLSTLTRNDLITTLSARAATLLASLASTHAIHAIISLGGSGGSALAAGVFRALPLGFPKLLVSTMAAGDVSSFVQDRDVAVMYSVTDIAGLNDILCPILENAAGAIAGMARAYRARVREMSTLSAPGAEVAARRDKGKRIAITMFGVTTPAVTHARALLAKYNCTPYVFHATGAGGRALERLTSEGFFDGVLDLTTTELADELVGGLLPAGPERLEAAARRGVPQVVSLGALDMVNFGPMNTVPEKWKRQERKLYRHNPSVTLMRTSPEECAQLGRIIAWKMREAVMSRGKTEVWIPRGGVSALSVGGAAFEDREADEALFHALQYGLSERGGMIRVVERDEDINNPDFVAGVVDSLVRMMDLEVRSNE